MQKERKKGVGGLRKHFNSIFPFLKTSIHRETYTQGEERQETPAQQVYFGSTLATIVRMQSTSDLCILGAQQIW